MARLSSGAAALAAGPRRAVWELRRLGRRLYRRTGMAGLVLLAGLLACAAGLVLQQHQAQQLALARQAWLVQQAQPVARLPEPPASDGRARLAEFDAYLPAHAQIPVTVAALFDLAQQEGLTIARGDYKAQPEAAGGFMRYRLTWPVQGDAAAVRRFMLAALRGHRALALESVQFKRDRAATALVEARIQWVLFSRLPVAGAGVLSTAAAVPAQQGAATSDATASAARASAAATTASVPATLPLQALPVSATGGADAAAPVRASGAVR